MDEYNLNTVEEDTELSSDIRQLYEDDNGVSSLRIYPKVRLEGIIDSKGNTIFDTPQKIDDLLSLSNLSDVLYLTGLDKKKKQQKFTGDLRLCGPDAAISYMNDQDSEETTTVFRNGSFNKDLIPTVSGSDKGLMSSADKTKLDGINVGALENQNAFSQIEIVRNGLSNQFINAGNATDSFKISAGDNINIDIDNNRKQITFSSVNSVYEGATGSNSGLMTSTDKAKLDKIILSKKSEQSNPSDDAYYLKDFVTQEQIAALLPDNIIKPLDTFDVTSFPGITKKTVIIEIEEPEQEPVEA